MTKIKVVPLKRGLKETILHTSLEELERNGVTTVTGLKKKFIMEKQLISNAEIRKLNGGGGIVAYLAKKIRLIHNGVLLGNAHSLSRIDFNLSEVLHLVFDSSDCITLNDRIKY